MAAAATLGAAAVTGCCGLGAAVVGVAADRMRSRVLAAAAAAATALAAAALPVASAAPVPRLLAALIGFVLGWRLRPVGLTGGIGSGKSTVSAMLDRMGGAAIVDADMIAREVVQPGCWGLRRAFGEDILNADGTLNRERLRDIAFRDSNGRRRLNAATHLPIIVTMLLRTLRAAWLSPATFVVLDAPLLFETNVVVDCSLETQLARICARDKCDRQEAQRIIDAQMSAATKRRLADIIIDNDSTLGHLEAEVAKAIQAVR